MKRSLLWIMVTFGLASCGGDSDSVDVGKAPVPISPEGKGMGVYTTNNNQVQNLGVIDQNQKVWYLLINNDKFDGLFTAKLNTSNNSYSSSNHKFYKFQGNYSTPSISNFLFNPNGRLSANIKVGLINSVTYSLDSWYSNTINKYHSELDQIVGSYEGNAYSSKSENPAEFSIARAGIIYGKEQNGCSYVGQIKAVTNSAIYEVEMQFKDTVKPSETNPNNEVVVSTCKIKTLTSKADGVLFYDEVNQNMYMMSADFSNAYVLVGKKVN